MKRRLRNILLLLFFLPLSIPLPFLYLLLLFFSLLLFEKRMLFTKLTLLFVFTLVFIVSREIYFWESFERITIFDFAALRFLTLALVSLFVFTVLAQSDFVIDKLFKKLIFVLILFNLIGYLLGVSYNAPIEGDGRVFLWPTTTLVFLLFFALKDFKPFRFSIIMFILLLTKSRALLFIIALFISQIIFKSKKAFLVSFAIVVLVLTNSNVLFERLRENSFSEDARYLELFAVLHAFDTNSIALLIGSPFSVQIWEGMVESGGIFDSEAVWAVYSKYEIHNFFLIFIFRMGIPLTMVWLLVILKYIRDSRLRGAFVILGVTSNAFLTNPEALGGFFIAKKLK